MSKTIVFILDETGSMGPQREQTITKFNEYLDETAKAVKRLNQIKFTFVSFNSSKYEVREKDKPIKKVAKISYETYEPRASTPLYDAIGKTISEVKGPALVVILTDGQENASKEYNLASIKALIEAKEKEGWMFVFLGADLSVAGQAGLIGVNQYSTASYRGSTATAMAAASTISSDYSRGVQLQSTQSYVDEAEKEAKNAKN